MRRILTMLGIVILCQILLIGGGLVTGLIYFPFAPMEGPPPDLMDDPAVGDVASAPGGDDFDITGDFGSVGAPNENTVEILPGNSFESTLSAAGKIELVETHDAVVEVSGAVHTIMVQEGAQVAAGDLLLSLDTTTLERAVAKAEIELATAQIEFQKLLAGTSESELAVSQAELLAAQENLAKTKAGPTAEELAAATSNATAAWAKYNDLLAPPSAAKITEAKAGLMKAEIELQEAQRAYNEVAWMPEVGMTAEAAALQKATVEYERVKAIFDEANQPTTESDQQSALSAAQKAQDELNQLRNKPTPAELAEAAAKVAEAAAKVSKLQTGPAATDVQAAELKIRSALIGLEEAHNDLRNTQVYAPATGTVLAVKVKPGERTSPGTVAVTIGDTSQLKLTINVAEVDIRKLRTNQPAVITLDAMRGQGFTGEVAHIAPLSKDEQNVVNYPVTIRLTSEDLGEIRAGMTALATFAQERVAGDTWLVPTSALRREAGKTFVTVVRAGESLAVAIEAGAAQGEWTYVRSTELSQGDRVVGQIASFVDEQAGIFVN